ncbi:MAG: NrdH-redoxin [Nocardioidaceae bacterium]|nr:NrdH-redoxin [Nocardioidaceae bacterium]
MGFFGSSRTVPHAEAQQAAQDGVAIYWRPGCTFCLALKTRIGRYAGRASWVNIWEDADAAAYVRSVNDGNETVPTVVINGVAHTNPSPGVVRKALAALG